MPNCEFVAGWGGGVFGLLTGHPFDTVKVLQQTQGIGIRQCAQTIYQIQGLKGFFRGMGGPLLAQGAMNSVFFGVYGSTLAYLDNSGSGNSATTSKLSNPAEQIARTRNPQISYSNCFLAGLAAGLAQLTVATPAEVVKIKLQTRSANESVFRGPAVLVRHILKNQGIRGLYQGVSIMAIRDMPASGVYMLLYEIGSSYVNKYSANKKDVPNSIGLFLAGGVAGTLSWWLILPIDVIKSQIQSQDRKSSSYRGALNSIKYIWERQGLKGFLRGFWAVSIRAFPVNGVTLLSYEWFTYICHYINDTSNSRANSIGN